ncbi:hypothetical protein RJ640_009426 [Escallonia rubra]|uniref:Guanylyl cyclase n=1 Tax=Escallonia rubra TaxID=112253 RepID=A0AA88QFA5_9ASTE|nr:hypothetical protein RJ640_009426 [Escallonia rubra]
MRSQMWPLYLLFNKLLKTEEQIVHESDKQLDSSESSCRESLSCEKFNDAIFPLSHFVAVPHVSQLHSWDCGLACVLMVLKTLGTSYCTIQELGQLCSTTSIWTVDLAYLLQKYSVSFSYFTVTLGANPNFSLETFYKEQLPNDLERVDLLFKKALEAGINIECRSISGEEISLLILSGKYIAIALVDQYKLSQSWLQDVPISGFHSDSSGYTGHYIVVCGYDAVTDEFEIRDPASSSYSFGSLRLPLFSPCNVASLCHQDLSCLSNYTKSEPDLLRPSAGKLCSTKGRWLELRMKVAYFPSLVESGFCLSQSHFPSKMNYFEHLGRKHDRVTSRCLEEARKSFGTDEDLVMVLPATEQYALSHADFLFLGPIYLGPIYLIEDILGDGRDSE